MTTLAQDADRTASVRLSRRRRQHLLMAVLLNPLWALCAGALGVLLIGLFHAWHGAIGK